MPAWKTIITRDGPCENVSSTRPPPSPLRHLPSALRPPPSALRHLPSAICHLPFSLSDPPSPSHQAVRHSPFTVSRQFPWPGADRSPDLLTRSDSRLRVLWRARCDRTEGSWIKVEPGTTSGGRRRSTGKRP